MQLPAGSWQLAGDQMVLVLYNLYQKLKPLTIETFSKDNSKFLKKHFKITKKQLNSIYSKNPLEDILIEKGAILI